MKGINAGTIAREGDMLSGHGSFPPHPFPVGGSIKRAFVEGVKMLCVGSIDTAHLFHHHQVHRQHHHQKLIVVHQL